MKTNLIKPDNAAFLEYGRRLSRMRKLIAQFEVCRTEETFNYALFQLKVNILEQIEEERRNFGEAYPSKYVGQSARNLALRFYNFLQKFSSPDMNVYLENLEEKKKTLEEICEKLEGICSPL